MVHPIIYFYAILPPLNKIPSIYMFDISQSITSSLKLWWTYTAHVTHVIHNYVLLRSSKLVSTEYNVGWLCGSYLYVGLQVRSMTLYLFFFFPVTYDSVSINNRALPFTPITTIFNNHSSISSIVFSSRSVRLIDMEIMQTLHMNKGNGETSYAKNSKVQVTLIINWLHILLMIFFFFCALIHFC